MLNLLLFADLRFFSREINAQINQRNIFTRPFKIKLFSKIIAKFSLFVKIVSIFTWYGSNFYRLFWLVFLNDTADILVAPYLVFVDCVRPIIALN